ncbi:MAG: ParB N-terminal domain-containing protein [Oscillospiraceae bacterium]|jgi:hypothetical protein|nr:ParB N-terminal domain-containing protein [Oscillospiraceae bacterium]
MQIAKRYELVPLIKIIPYTNNPRKHSKEQIAQIRASFREFGVLSPCLVDENYNLIAGHGRLEAARLEGLTEINCVIAEGLTEAQRKAFVIADNKLTENSSWDNELLTLEFGELKELGFNAELTGFSLADIEKLFAAGAEAQEDDFDVDKELDKPTFSKAGDIWTLGRHRVICGDSTKPETYAALMQGKQANLIVTDPPYGIDYQGAAGKIKNDKFDTEEHFYKFLYDAFINMAAALANDGAAYLFHADSKGLVFRKAFDDAGFKLSGNCIWAKNSFTLGRSDYQWGHEPCLYGWKKSGKHNWYGDRKQSTIWNCDKPSRSEKHPTMKPIPLLAIPIQNSSQTNGFITNAMIADATILNAKIGTVDAAKITTGTINAARIGAGSITADKISANFLQTLTGSQSIRITGSTISYFSGTNMTSQINANGFEFTRDNIRIGRLGTNSFSGQPSWRGLVFDLENAGNYMSWSWRETATAGSYTTRFTYYRSRLQNGMERGFHFDDTVFFKGGLSVASGTTIINNNIGFWTFGSTSYLARTTTGGRSGVALGGNSLILGSQGQWVDFNSIRAICAAISNRRVFLPASSGGLSSWWDVTIPSLPGWTT